MKLFKISDFLNVVDTQDDAVFCAAEDMGYACEYDALGSLYCRKARSGGAAGGGLMLAAAMDVKRFMVTHVSGKNVWFNLIGGLEAKNIVDQKVRFESGLTGTIRQKGHEEGLDEEKKKECKLEDLYILTDSGEGEMPEIGEEAVLDGPDVYADNMISCIALLHAMEELEEDLAEENVTFVFPNQFWSGRMGLRAALQAVKPHTCILCSASEALAEGDEQDPDRPVDLILGRGPVIRFRESLQTFDAETGKKLVAAAESAGIKWQGEARCREIGGGVEITATGGRAGEGYLGVPMKDRGTVKPQFCEEDVEGCVKVLVQFVKMGRAE